MKMRPLQLIALCLYLMAFKSRAATYYVDINSPDPTPPYTSWSTAATNIQSAVTETTNGDLVLVNPGDYHSGGTTANGSSLTNRVVITNAITVQSVNGPSVTVIEGYRDTNIIDGNAVRCVYLSDGAVLSGFTLTKGATLASYGNDGDGGAAWCTSAAAILTNCIIAGNQNDAMGGGVYSGTLNGCLLTNNLAGLWGGGAFNSTLNNCILIDNNASFYGGGGAGQSILTRCILENNLANDSGGGAWDSQLTNCLVAGNRCGQLGGGVSACIINNCTVANNFAALNSGGADQQCTPYNCIVYYNTSSGSDQNIQAGTTVSYCCTFPTPTPIGSGNITNEPMFINVANDFHLESTSPCINTGNNSYVASTTDLDGNPRIFDGVVDMGAYEYQGFIPLTAGISVDNTNVAAGFPLQLQAVIGRGIAGYILWGFGDGTTATNELTLTHSWNTPGVYTITLIASNEFEPFGTNASLTINVAASPVSYVNANGTNPIPPYSSWDTAATHIQDAVNVGYDGEIVWVTNGIYQSGGETAFGGNLTNRVAITSAITVQSVNGPSVTTIEGYHDANITDNNAVRCVSLGAGAVLSGFTLTNGATMADGNDDSDDDGGGAWCASAAATLTNCVIVGNQAYYAGGGVFGGTVDWCLLTNNSTGNGYAFGGGACSNVLNFCVLAGNYGQEAGGGAMSCTLNNCLVAGNTVEYNGGGGEACDFNNCTISENTTLAGNGGGADGSTVNNSIIYYNSSNPDFAADDSGCTFSYSCTPDASGLGCITNAPLFINPAAGNFHFHINSPCIDAGSNGYVNWSVDLDGNPRVVNGTVDMGAYEYQDPALAIVAQPANQTNYLGQTAAFSVDAESPYPLSYQWLFNSNSIPGATSSNLILSNLQFTNAGLYSVLISNSVTSTNSAAAVLTVYFPPPVIVQQPTNLSVILGSNTLLSVSATSYLNMTFQWQLNGTNLADEGEFSGSTNSTLYITGAQAADAGNYQAIIADGEWSVTSALATVTVLFPAALTRQPTNQTVVVSNNVSMSVAVSGTGPLGFQWYFNGIPLANGGNISGSVSSNLDISNVQLTNTGLYQVIVTNSFSQATSVLATLTVEAPVQITVQPTNQAVLLGNTAGLSVNATGTGLGYRWYFNNVLMSDGGRISGSATANLNIANVQSSDGGNYQVIVSNNLNSVTSSIAVLTPLASPGPATRYVNFNSQTPASPYLSWNTAATTIQTAVNASESGDLVRVTNGIYRSSGYTAPDGFITSVVDTNAVSIESVNGPAFTRIDGNGSMRGLYLSDGGVLSGFTVTNGYVAKPGLAGGGIMAQSTNAMMTNCIIIACRAANGSLLPLYGGGGVYLGTLYNCALLTNSSMYGGAAYGGTLFNCSISNNLATAGGGVYEGILYNCLLTSNSASLHGGGVFNSVLTDSVLSNNVSSLGGAAYGGVFNNCLFIKNAAAEAGAVAGASVLLDCTISGNSASSEGGGLFSPSSPGPPDIFATNCIIYGNSAPTGSNYYFGVPESLSYCCTMPSPASGPGNITNSPLFVNITNNFRLQSNSPCINAGNNAFVSTAADLAGNPRIVGGTVDMGAYEYQTPTSIISYAWLQQYGLPADGSVDFKSLDGTAFDVYQDWVAGLNPTNPASILAMQTPVTINFPMGVKVSWKSVSGIPYFLQRSTNLATQPPFATIQNNIIGQPNTTSYTDTSATNNLPYFYRVGVVAP